MLITRSLRFKLSLGIVAVMLPLIMFTFYNNLNAKKIVEEKVSATYSNTLRIFVERVDDIMQETNNYIFKMESQDADVGVIQAYPYLSDQYILTKVRITQKLIRDVGFYNMISTIFLYSKDDIIYASQPQMNELLTLAIIRSHIDDLIDKTDTQRFDEWHLIEDNRVSGNYILARIYRLNTGFYAGCFIRIADIALPLDRMWNGENIGETVIADRTSNKLLTPVTLASSDLPLKDIPPSQQVSTHPLQSDKTQDRYLVMSQSSRMASITYHIIIPEHAILKNIPFLQKATYFIPLGIIVVLLIFFFFMNQQLFKPMGELMRGMKNISIGRLDARLAENKTTELNFLASSFNNMAEEVKNLKIDVYEEQLRVQKAEFKHLQAQISPHFYMNSLNIIYNFAALGDSESVKKMALHLADYFRFIMRTNQSAVSLAEELQHIGNYIEIQKIRFPGKMEYKMDVDPDLLKFELPALTLQPFVENAIIHGFKNRRALFHIRIDGKSLPDQRLELTVRDDGVGFSEEVREALNVDAPLAEAGSSRLGIRNVIHRLKLHYSNHVEVRFDHEESGGARVTIRLPLPAGGTGDAVREG